MRVADLLCPHDVIDTIRVRINQEIGMLPGTNAAREVNYMKMLHCCVFNVC